MERVAVTGADGFLGRKIVDRLIKEGKEVVAVVYPGNSIKVKSETEKLHTIELDLNSASFCLDSFPINIDTFYHFAWGGVRPEERNDTDIQVKNIRMTLECIKIAKGLGVKRFICPGSTNEYLYYGKPINKEAIPSPSNAYGAAKIAVRYLCSDYASRNGIDFIYAIITGIYAADRKDNNVIFYTIDKLLRGEKPSLTKLEQLWDYVYIDDVVEAMYLIGEKGKEGSVYAIGHGDNWQLSNYISLIHQLIDPSLPLGIGDIPYADNKLPSSCIDLSDIQRDTGYVPKVGFMEGISLVINRMKEEMGLRNE